MKLKRLVVTLFLFLIIVIVAFLYIVNMQQNTTVQVQFRTAGDSTDMSSKDMQMTANQQANIEEEAQSSVAELFKQKDEGTLTEEGLILAEQIISKVTNDNLKEKLQQQWETIHKFYILNNQSVQLDVPTKDNISLRKRIFFYSNS